MTALNKRARQVQRYTNYGVDMMEWDDGTYVKYSDYLALLDELEAAEKRIAELEAREMKLPRMAAIYWHLSDASKRRTSEENILDVLEAIDSFRAAGIGVKGD